MKGNSSCEPAWSIRVVLLACTTLAGCGFAYAAPRQSQEAGGQLIPDAPMDVWLRRLVGTFSFEGAVQVALLPEYEKNLCGTLPPAPGEDPPMEAPATPYCTGIHGKGDCVGVGNGPGVQCVLNVTWQEIHEVEEGVVYNLPGFVPYLNPAMTLHGLDPGKSAINYLLVDHKGLPEGGFSDIRGNRAIFNTPCVNTPALFNAMKLDRVDDRTLQTCERVLYIDAKPDSRVIHMSIDIEINERPFTRIQMTLRRQLKEETEERAGTR
jgi:hypothetical protein